MSSFGSAPPRGGPSRMREVKVVLLGQAGAGKSSLVLRFVQNEFRDYSESTIGASFMSKIMSVGTENIKFQIWDTAGQEKYKGLAPMYYRGAAAAILVYDITKQSSFATLKMWVTELEQFGPPNIVIAIAANKADLEDHREISREQGEKFAKEIGAIFLETSAKADTNVQSLFADLCKRIPSDTPPVKSQPAIQIISKEREGEKKGCCS